MVSNFDLDAVKSHSSEWYYQRKHRITASNARRAISGSDYFIDYMSEGGNEYYIKFGHKVELAVNYLFKGYFEEASYKVNSELRWLSATTDSLLKFNETLIPIEIKSTNLSLDIEDFLKMNYHQLNVIMRVYATDYLIFITYLAKVKVFKFYKVFVDQSYEMTYIPLLERSFYKHVVRHIFPQCKNDAYDKIIKTQDFKQTFLKYYTGNFEDSEKPDRSTKSQLTYKQITVKELVGMNAVNEIIKNFTENFSFRVNRHQISCWKFEKMYKNNDPNIYRDCEIQQILLGLYESLNNNELT